MQELKNQQIPSHLREKLNHQAYIDVLDSKEPTYINNEYYMECYYFWYGVGGEEK